jgi:hypothetical protein
LLLNPPSRGKVRPWGEVGARRWAVIMVLLDFS